ncbi:MAG: carboxypeptidase regulatory-like domain-containing protein [Chloroflexi bacterium]|nr:carboxypeptidase regulatory-like domain-containing protein [Chloroflexota bacterium]
MIKRIVLLIASFLLFLPVTARAAEQGNGTINGQVVNGTAGGASVANLDITLKTFLKDAAVGITSRKTDAEGRFSFSGLATDPTNSYEVRLTYQKADYFSDLINFGQGETTQSVTVNVFDSTTSDDAISIVLAHMVFYAGEGFLQVKEYVQVANMSDRTYIGSTEEPSLRRNETLRFDLPAGATELKYSLGLKEGYIASSGDGFVDTLPIIPGAREVSYSYKVSYDPAGYTVSKKVTYPIMNFNLLIEDKGITAASSMLTAQETLNIGGVQLKHYAGGKFTRGDTISAQLSGVPQAQAQPQPQLLDQDDTAKWVGLAVASLAAAFGVIMLRRKKPQPAASLNSARQKEEQLLLELARLDDDFEKGSIPEESYRKLRADRKAQLAALIRKPKGDAGKI